MIQKALSKQFEEAFPGLTWTYDNYTEADNTGTVYLENGPQPGRYETFVEHPRYMVYLRSSNSDYLETVGRGIKKMLHKSSGELYDVEFLDQNYNVIEVVTVENMASFCSSDFTLVNRTDNGIYEYSGNFDFHIIEQYAVFL